VWRAQTILDLLEKHEPAMYRHIATIRDAIDTPRFNDVLATEFQHIKGTSIDYAVMERAEEVAVIEAPFDWDDVGNWTSLERLHRQTDEGNTIIGRCVTVDTSNSILRSEKDHLIATVGVQDLIVVHTENATLVANRHDEESVRKIVALLEEEDLKEYL
jgi:mannose-1-phosphate guanylyltransferase